MTEQITLDGRYTVLEEIGHGGFGITYKAVNKNNDQLTAIKSFRDTSKEKILKEARILKDFSDDPAIVSVLDYFEDEKQAYIVMEFLEGSTLREHILKDGKWSMEKTVRTFTPVMNALIRIHGLGLIHRDISPDNLMILPDGTMKLLDFGSAKRFDQNTMTMSGVYKSSYSPPEHIEGNGKTGPFTDIYSLCATIYFCITGSDPEDVLSRLLFDELEVPSRLGADILPQTEKCIMKGLALDSKERIQTVKELLNTFLTYYPDLTEEEKKAAELKKKKRRKILASALTGALLVSAALAFYFRIPILFHFIETEAAYFNGTNMSEEEFRNNAEIVRARTEAFTGGRFLWKEEGQGITVQLPYASFHDENPQNLLRTVITRPMVMTVVSPEQNGEETNYGTFSQTEEVESVKRDEEGLLLTFTDEAAARFDGFLDEKDRDLILYFDREKLYQYPLTIEAKTVGDGSRIRLSPTQDFLPDELWQQLLTKETLDKNFQLDSEWKVQWEKVEDSLFPGKNQVNSDFFDTTTVCYRYRPDENNKEVDGYDASELSFQAILKNRLDSIEIPYAVGRSVHEPETMVVRFKPEDIWPQETEILGNSVLLKYGSDIAISNTYLFERLEIREVEDSCVLAIPITDYHLSDASDVLETILSQNRDRLYLYLSNEEIPVASTDAVHALQTLKDESTIMFDMWEMQDPQQISRENAHFGRFLASAVSQDPEKNYSLDSVEILNRDGTKKFAEDTTEYLPEVYSELPEGIADEWSEKYGDVKTEYYSEKRYLRLYFYQRKLDDPESALTDLLRFYEDNKEILYHSHIRELYVMLFADSEEEAVEPYIGLDFRMKFETGERILYFINVYGFDETTKGAISEKYDNYVRSVPELAGMINEGEKLVYS